MRISMSLIVALSLVVKLSAQGKCSKFYPIKKNAFFIHTIYSDEPSLGGIEQGKVTYKVTEVEENWAFYTVKVEAMGFSSPEMKQKITCTDDGVVIKNMQPGSTEGSETSGDDNFYLPNDLGTAGSLDDVVMQLNNGPSTVMRSMTNRYVTGVVESVATPAGTFSCYKMTYTTTMGAFVTNNEQWMTEGKGVIKATERDSDGNLLSVTLLTAYSLGD